MKSNAEQQIFGLVEIPKQNSLCRNISAYKHLHRYRREAFGSVTLIQK
jgi:hypothetical protein